MGLLAEQQAQDLPAYPAQSIGPQVLSWHRQAVICWRNASSLPCPYLFRQLVLVFSGCLLQFGDARLLLLDHSTQVLDAVVVWQLIFGHLQAAAQSGERAEQMHSMVVVVGETNGQFWGVGLWTGLLPAPNGHFFQAPFISLLSMLHPCSHLLSILCEVSPYRTWWVPFFLNCPLMPI